MDIFVRIAQIQSVQHPLRHVDLANAAEMEDSFRDTVLNTAVTSSLSLLYRML